MNQISYISIQNINTSAMKKLLRLLLVFVPFALTSYGQINDEDSQLFGSSRSVTSANSYNFGHITENVVSHQFLVKNASPSAMTIVNVDAPEGVGITILDKVIQPKTVGKFNVTLHKNLFPKGDFEKVIKITIQQEDALGKTTKEIEYKISGNL